MDDLLSGGFGVFLALFLLVIALLWFLLPFAIFGTKEKLNILIRETQQTNLTLSKIAHDLEATRNLASAPTAKATAKQGQGALGGLEGTESRFL